jgi:hypothetical protein
MVERQCSGVLLPSVELPFDAEEHAGKTVADVLADPDSFAGATLADPLEGVSYGLGKAKIMQRPDGTIWINSFAHGRTTYELKYDAAAIQAVIDTAGEDAAAAPIIKMMAQADLADDEEGHLKDRIAQKTGTRLRPLASMLKAARGEQARARAEERAAARAASNNDHRVHLAVPAADAERTPVILALDEVLTQTGEHEPPMRNLDGHPVEVRDRAPSALHELTSGGSNQDEAPKTRLPPPAMPLLSTHDKYSMAHLVERYIGYEAMIEQGGAVPCALPPVFVDHYMNYRDSALPRVSPSYSPHSRDSPAGVVQPSGIA